MVIQIPGHISVSHDFFEDREELEETFNVGIDHGPGGTVEVGGDDEDVLSFIEEFGIKFSDVTLVE